MPVENSTPNRGYQLPFADNNLNDDVARLIVALTGIDLDVASLIAAVATKAASVHAHVINDTTGLQAALDAKQDADERGQANGFASLDAGGKVPVGQLPAALFGAMAYQGTWNASTNTPTIPAASAGNKGYYYKVGTAGATNVSGEIDWKVGDWIVSNGGSWDKIDNTDQVSSVAGLVGVITAAALKTALALVKADVGLGSVDNTSDSGKPVSTAQAASIATKVAKAGDALTGGFTTVYADDGAKASGTYTPTYVGGNFKYAKSTGAWTLAAPTAMTAGSIVIFLENQTGAGAVTLTGFMKVTGDTLTTTLGHLFMLYITVVGSGKHLHIQAMQ